MMLTDKCDLNKKETKFGLLLEGDSERAASAFNYPAPAAKMFGGFASSAEAKSASMSEAPSSSHFERAASAFRLKYLFYFDNAWYFFK